MISPHNTGNVLRNDVGKRRSAMNRFFTKAGASLLVLAVTSGIALGQRGHVGRGHSIGGRPPQRATHVPQLPGARQGNLTRTAGQGLRPANPPSASGQQQLPQRQQQRRPRQGGDGGDRASDIIDRLANALQGAGGGAGGGSSDPGEAAPSQATPVAQSPGTLEAGNAAAIKGVRITTLYEGPAADLGLQLGHTIWSYHGIRTRKFDDLAAAVAQAWQDMRDGILRQPPVLVLIHPETGELHGPFSLSPEDGVIGVSGVAVPVPAPLIPQYRKAS
jgi:hypothetical protein